MAIDDFSNALKRSPNSHVIHNNRGNALRRSGEHRQAIEDFNTALRLNSNYANALYNRGLTHQDLKEYERAVEDYQTYNALTKDDKADFHIARAKDALKEQEQEQANSYFEKVSRSVKNIKSLLAFEGECLVHYTQLKATKAIVFIKSPFRLSEGSYLNDTSEGRELYQYLGQAFQDEEQTETFIPKPFIGSFVPPNQHDDLTLWRMYGKDRKQEANGCSLTFNLESFRKALNLKFTPKSDDDDDRMSSFLSDDIFSFYQVVYRNHDNNSFILPPNPNLTRQKNAGLNRSLNQHLKKLKENVEEAKSDKTIQKHPNVWNKILEKLEEIAYLFKGDAYQFEREIRLVVDGVGFKKHIESGEWPKVYIELAEMASSLTQITLGPKVDGGEEWAAALHYHFEGEEHPPSISISRLPFK